MRRMSFVKIVALGAAAATLAGCTCNGCPNGDSADSIFDSETDTDTDSDSDSDTDSDSDSDSDSDT